MLLSNNLSNTVVYYLSVVQNIEAPDESEANYEENAVNQSTCNVENFDIS